MTGTTVMTRTLIKVMAAALLIGLVSGSAVQASSGSQNAAIKAAGYLKTTQHDDGGFGVDQSTIGETATTVLSIRIAGAKLPKSKSGKTPIDFLESDAHTLKSQDVKVNNVNMPLISTLVLALTVSGQNPRSFDGTNWVRVIKDTQDPATGWYGYNIISQTLAMAALESTGEAVPDKAVLTLKLEQQDDGGFNSGKKSDNGGSDTNSTALVVQALEGAGVKSNEVPVKKALAFLKSQQNKDGGFPLIASLAEVSESDATSTAWVIQSLLAAGQDIEGKSWTKTSVTPMGFLMSLQNADGSFISKKTVPGGNFLSTCQVIPALMERSFPMKSPAQATVKKPQKTTGLSRVLVWIGGLVAVIAILAVVGFVVFRSKKE